MWRIIPDMRWLRMMSKRAEHKRRSEAAKKAWRTRKVRKMADQAGMQPAEFASAFNSIEVKQ